MEFDVNAFLIYVRPAERPERSEEEAEAIQRAHLDHLGEMGRLGHIVSAGPFDEQSDERMRGLVIFAPHVTLEQARELFVEDPAVKAGVLSFELMQWYRPKGQVAFNATDFAPEG